VVAPAEAHQQMEYLGLTTRAVVSSSNLVVRYQGGKALGKTIVAAFSLADGRKLAEAEFPFKIVGTSRKIAVNPDGSRIAVLLMEMSADGNTHIREITVYSAAGDAAVVKKWTPRSPVN